MRIIVFFCLSVPPQCICCRIPCLLKCKNNYHGAQIYISNLLHLFIYESSHSLFSFSPHLHCSLIQLYCLSALPPPPTRTPPQSSVVFGCSAGQELQSHLCCSGWIWLCCWSSLALSARTPSPPPNPSLWAEQSTNTHTQQTGSIRVEYEICIRFVQVYIDDIKTQESTAALFWKFYLVSNSKHACWRTVPLVDPRYCLSVANQENVPDGLR